MDCLVKEIKFRLKELGIDSAPGPNMPQLRPLQKAFLYRVVLFGAFYPQFFGRSAGQIDEREAVKELVGCDPFNTIKLSGWKMEQNGKAYIGQLRYSLDNLLSIVHFILFVITFLYEIGVDYIFRVQVFSKTPRGGTESNLIRHVYSFSSTKRVIPLKPKKFLEESPCLCTWL